MSLRNKSRWSFHRRLLVVNDVSMNCRYSCNIFKKIKQKQNKKTVFRGEILGQYTDMKSPSDFLHKQLLP